MSVERLRTSLHCPACGFRIAARTTVCENCGAVIPVAELAGSGVVSNAVATLLGRPLGSLSLLEIARILAWVPLLVGPPIAALAIIGLKVSQQPQRLHDRAWQGPALVAALNIALSLIVWHYAAQEIGAAATALWTHIDRLAPTALPAGPGKGVDI
ncbi:hypothetical protein [Ancylobacter vacuolatus]|uniref:Uncharacterized membrane protein YhaH (DUF805 family) n=1 Tax=Ancylobacter vacuolatus TaxID=223389 RepID=A0ABU0DMM9_9HYPH|nr:hypothetical protein [Ancylobacter vacuolatus]MDQ0349465.1 uncharacterized membrane protein YhaH (DUF805 family) [Ancylobacter vacuolatus]